MPPTPTAAELLERGSVRLHTALRLAEQRAARDELVRAVAALEGVGRSLVTVAAPYAMKSTTRDRRLRVATSLCEVLQKTVDELNDAGKSLREPTPANGHSPMVDLLEAARTDFGVAGDLLATHFRNGRPHTVDGVDLTTAAGQWPITVQVTRPARLVSQLTYEIALGLATVDRSACPTAGRLLTLHPEINGVCATVESLVDLRGADEPSTGPALAASSKVLPPRDNETPRDLLDGAAVITRSLRDTAYRAAATGRAGPHSASALRVEASTFALVMHELGRLYGEAGAPVTATAMEGAAQGWVSVRRHWSDFTTVADLGARHPMVKQCGHLQARVLRVTRDAARWAPGDPLGSEQPLSAVAEAVGLPHAELLDRLATVIGPIQQTRHQMVEVVERLATLGELLIPTRLANNSPETGLRYVADDTGRTTALVTTIQTVPTVDLHAERAKVRGGREAAIPGQPQAVTALEIGTP